MKLEIPQVLLTQTLQQLSAEPLVLAGRPIERYSIEELQGYAKSGVLAGPVLAKVDAELQRRTAESGAPNSAPGAELAPPGDELDTALKKFADKLGINGEPAAPAAPGAPGSRHETVHPHARG